MSIRGKQKHDCPCCTCGMISLEWSDREIFVRPDDVDGLVGATISCALDSFCDREPAPYGLPNGLRERLLEVVPAAMDQIWPTWPERTVYATDEECSRLEAAVRACVVAFFSSGGKT